MTNDFIELKEKLQETKTLKAVKVILKIGKNKLGNILRDSRISKQTKKEASQNYKSLIKIAKVFEKRFKN